MSDDLQLNLIAAVGRSGQLGIKGRLPWHDPEDLAFFKATTMGHIVLVGARTFATLPMLPGRYVIPWHGRAEAVGSMLEYLHRKRAEIEKRGVQVFVAGGAYTYKAFMPYVRRVYLTHITYDGPADTFMPPFWEFNRVAWQVIADRHAVTIANLTQDMMRLTKERDEALRKLKAHDAV